MTTTEKNIRSFGLAVSAAILFAGCTAKTPMPPPSAPPPEKPVVVQSDVPPQSEWQATASESDSNAPAAYACDGKMDTRWCSPYSAETAWLEIDLGRAATICGCTIQWERACGTRYQIQVSEDKTNWTTVYEMNHGDGAADDLFFTPVKARYVRMFGLERVNPWWGYSIWEFNIRGMDERIGVKAEGQDDMETLSLFDGKTGTLWRSATPPPCHIDVDLAREMPLGGVWIDWGRNFGTRASLLVSSDGQSWEKAGSLTDGVGGADTIQHPQKNARYFRLEIEAASENAPVEIREISLCSPGGNDDPVFNYGFAARKSRRGLYPLQFLKEQVFWTLVGLPGDFAESLLDEYGNFEPTWKNASLMPYLWSDNRIVSAVDAERVTQSMERNYLPLPSVAWESKPVAFNVRALARGTANQDSASYLLYTVKNTSGQPQKGRLFLVIRPVQVNPTWQYGGLSPIDSLEFRESFGGMGVFVSNRLWCVSWPAPDGTAARAFAQGDIMEDLARGRFPESRGVAGAGQQISGALAFDFDLQPGKEKNILVAAPLHDSTADIEALAGDIRADSPALRLLFEREYGKQTAFWSGMIDRVKIDLPEKDVVEMLKAQLSYIEINRDGPAIEPGSRNYKRAFLRDGCLTSASLLRMGFVDEVRQYLDWYAARVQTNGWVPPILMNDGSINKGFGWDNEYDSQGEFVFAMMEYYRFTKDRAFVEKHFDAIVQALKYLEMLRNQTLVPGYMADQPAPERFVGILPKSISHEGYFPPVHSHWDNLFALKGWKDGAEAARLLGKTDVAAWADDQYRQLRKSVRLSMDRTVEYKKIDFVPASADYGDFDPTSTTMAFFPCEETDMLDPQLVRQTWERYSRDVSARCRSFTQGGYTPYEARNITALVELGWRDRAMELLSFLLEGRRPTAWNHVAEVVFSDPRKGSYLGDMPHTWCGSGFINAIRSMLVHETGQKLVLLPGAPRNWFEGNGITLGGLPTYFGKLDLNAGIQGNVLKVTIGGDAAPGDGFELRWPVEGKPTEIVVDGQPWTDFDEKEARVPTTARTVTVKW